MPTISLRLSDEQHAELKAWAHGSMRSIQREAVFRIFDARHGVEQESGGDPSSARSVDDPPDQSERGGEAVRDDYPHFKPDFK